MEGFGELLSIAVSYDDSYIVRNLAVTLGIAIHIIMHIELISYVYLVL